MTKAKRVRLKAKPPTATAFGSISKNRLDRGPSIDRTLPLLPFWTDLKPGDYVQIIYQWGPLGGVKISKKKVELDEQLADPHIAFGEFVELDEYNIVIRDANGLNYIPMGCIRKPGWIRIIERA